MQVEGKEMDVEMQGRTKADGEVGLDGSIQHGKEKVRIDCKFGLRLPSATRTATLHSWSW